MDQNKYRVLTGMGVPHDYAVALAGGNDRLRDVGLASITEENLEPVLQPLLDVIADLTARVEALENP